MKCHSLVFFVNIELIKTKSVKKYMYCKKRPLICLKITLLSVKFTKEKKKTEKILNFKNS